MEPTGSLYGVGEDSVGRVVLGVVDETVLNEGQINSWRTHEHVVIKKAQKVKTARVTVSLVLPGMLPKSL